MQPMFATIPVRTERQAMDWSLVLVSQGIEATIERDAQTNLWRLVVDAPDYPRALQAIRLYRAENRHRVWRQQLPWTGLIFDWRCLVPLLFLIVLFAIQITGRGDLNSAGMMSNRAVHAGEWWRVLTAVTLHGDLAHLAANLTTGFLLLGLAMGTLGPGTGLLAAFLAGVGGNLAGLLCYPETHRGLGASGLVMGALGLLAAQWLALLRHGLTPRQLAARGVLSGCLLLVLLGFSPAGNVDVLAHVAGFLTGLALGAGFSLCPRHWLQSARVDFGAAVACGTLVGTAWWLALRSVMQ
jgi:membrane associated rhomboid family serine protease